MFSLGGNLLGRGGTPLKAEGPGNDERLFVDFQLRSEEIGYWMELEKLLARFCRDLDRVMCTLEALGETEAWTYLDRARFNTAAACCVAAERPRQIPVSI